MSNSATELPVRPEGGTRNTVDVERFSRVRPPIQIEIVEASVRAVLTTLDANAGEAVADGGAPLTRRARRFVAEATSEIISKALLNPNFSFEDFRLTPFARMDGGAYLIVNFNRTGKRLTIEAVPDGTGAWVARTAELSTEPGVQVLSAGEIGRFLGWLTSRA